MAQLEAPIFANDVTDTKSPYKLHIAIDFGTDGLGLAYAIDNKVFVHSRWNSEKYRDVVKPKTIILLDKDGKTEQFGLDAKELYMKLQSKKEHMLFERFKMSLYDDQIKTSINNESKGNEDNDEKKSSNTKIDIKTQLKAVNGKLYSSEAVFIAAFQHLEKESKKFLRKQKIKIQKHEIQWIITVPAIWSDKAKNYMKQWIIKAGLVDEKDRNQCKIVYEPDCASLAIQHEINDRKRNQKDDIKNNDFCKGEKYILVDAGGGTVDVACHEILGEFGVKEILPPSGGPWGSCYIDDEYKQTLDQIFGKELMDEFKIKHANIYLEAMHHFQRAKSHFDGNNTKDHNCRLPDDFIAWLEEKIDDNDSINYVEDIVTNSVMGQSNLATLNDEMLELNNIVWISMFDQVIDPLIHHIKRLLDEPTLMRNCKYLCLVGGLSCSPYFKSKMETEFGEKSRYKLQLITPQKPILSVVQGAAYFGVTDNYIKARRLRGTYGISKCWSIEKARNNGISEEWIKMNTDEMNKVHGCFKIVARKNAEIVTNQILKTYGNARAQLSGIYILYSDIDDPKTRAQAKIIGKIIIDMGQNWKENAITIEYHFYDTCLRVYAYPRGKSENKKSIDIIYQSQ